MFYAKGEIRPVKDRTFMYTDQQQRQQTGREMSVTVELENGDHVDVKFSREQIAAGLPELFAAAKGRMMTLPVDVSCKAGRTGAFMNVYLSPKFVFPVAAPAAVPAAAAAK